MKQASETDVTAVWTHSGTSLVGRIVVLLSRAFVKPFIGLWARHPHARWPYGVLEALAALLPAVSGVRRDRIVLPNCEAERQRPAGYVAGEAPRAILYLHGGAFVIGGVKSHRRLVSRIVRESGIPSLAVAYRQLPDHPITSSIEDCMEGLGYLLDSGIAPEHIAVVGDSAGGYLALNVVSEARRRNMGTLGAAVCISPIIDLEPTRKLAQPNVDRDPLFPPEALTAMWDLATSAESDSDGVAALRRIVTSPLSDLAAMPPTLIQVGSSEILRPDADYFVALSSAAGGDVKLDVYPHQIHVFPAGSDLIPEGRVALARIARHLTRNLGLASE